MIACNTASTLVMSHLRSAYQVPFVGTVPAIKPACAASKTKRVSVLGTKGTVKREYTQATDPRFCAGLRGDAGGLGRTRLAGRIRAQRQRGERRGHLGRTRALLCRRCGDAARTDTVVLACTHYPLLLDRLVKLAPWPVDWIDPAPAIARRVVRSARRSRQRKRQAGAEMIFTSKRPHTLSQALMPFFGGRVPA